jgi:hypothetical protein
VPAYHEGRHTITGSIPPTHPAGSPQGVGGDYLAEVAASGAPLQGGVTLATFDTATTVQRAVAHVGKSQWWSELHVLA